MSSFATAFLDQALMLHDEVVAHAVQIHRIAAVFIQSSYYEQKKMYIHCYAYVLDEIPDSLGCKVDQGQYRHLREAVSVCLGVFDLGFVVCVLALAPF